MAQIYRCDSEKIKSGLATELQQLDRHVQALNWQTRVRRQKTHGNPLTITHKRVFQLVQQLQPQQLRNSLIKLTRCLATKLPSQQQCRGSRMG